MKNWLMKYYTLSFIYAHSRQEIQIEEHYVELKICVAAVLSMIWVSAVLSMI